MNASRFLLLGLLSLTTACQASVTANTKTGADAEFNSEDDFDDLDEPTSSGDHAAFVTSLPEEAESSSEVALFGARHDVSLATKQPATCRCLGVAAGAATDLRFVWEGQPPILDLDAQLVVAFSSSDQPCDVDEPRPLAAYKGYEKSGNDIIVMLEAARPGRPNISAAVIPRPTSGGRLLLRPANKKLPFGQSKDAAGGLCEITSLPDRSLDAAP